MRMRVGEIRSARPAVFLTAPRLRPWSPYDAIRAVLNGYEHPTLIISRYC